MTPSLWRELATYAAEALIVAAVLFQLEDRTRTALTFAIVGGSGLVACLAIQALGIA